jgi:hypothetical protein
MSAERRVIISPLNDVAPQSPLRTAAALELWQHERAFSFGKPTAQLVASSLNGAIAALRSGEVANVPSTRILNSDYRQPVSLAASWSDVTPKHVVRSQQQRLYV